MYQNIDKLKVMFRQYKEDIEYQGEEGDLSVWHIPQVPMKAFRIPVSTPQEGKWVMDLLAYYDLFQLNENIKPDYSNASGLDVFENGEWVTWYNENGEDIDRLEVNENNELVEEE